MVALLDEVIVYTPLPLSFYKISIFMQIFSILVFFRLGFSTYFGVMCTPIDEIGVFFVENPPRFALYGHRAAR